MNTGYRRVAEMERGSSAPIVVVVLVMIAVLAGAVFMIMGGEAGGPSADETQRSEDRNVGRDAPAVIDEGSEETRRTTEVGDPEAAKESEDSTDAEELEEELIGTGLSGRVLGFDGLPRPEVVVIAEREVSHRSAAKFQVEVPDGERTTRFSRSATTREDGRFAITDLIGGGGYQLRSESKDGGIGSREGLLVVESLISDVGDLGLRRGARVRGRVRTEAGAPVPGAKVLFGQIWNARPVQSGEDGTFDAGVLQPGRHQIRVEKSGVVLPNAITMEFIEDDVVDNLELVVVPASVIRGRVLDDAGRPLAGASVSATRRNKGNDMMMWFAMSRNTSVRSDKQGRFAFDSLLSGEYDLSVNCPGYESGEAKNITAGGPPIDIELPQFATIHGVVLDAKTGQPTKPDGVSLFWKPPWGDDGGDTLQPFWSDPDAEIREDGSFTLGVNQAGLFAVEAKKEGFAAARSERFEIEKGAVRSGIVIRLQPGRSLSVTVVDKASRVPLPGSLVELRVAPDAPDASSSGADAFLLHAGGSVRQGGAQRGGLVGREVSGEGGNAEIQSIRNGRFELFVRMPGYCEAIVRDIEVRAGAEPAPILVAMTPGGSIEGVVRDDRGRVLTAHGVVVQGKSASRREAVTEAGGRYRADHLTPGRYKVTAQEETVENPMPFMMWGSAGDSNAKPDDYPVVVEEGGVATFDLSVTVEEPGALAGSVLWNGRPGVGLQISASRQDDNDDGARMMGLSFGNMVKSDDRGMFEFRRLRPGRYRITAGKSWQRMFEGGETTVQSGATARISIEVGFGGIRGRVVDGAGAPIAGASVSSRLTNQERARSPFGGWASRRNARTAEDGTFELEEMERGAYTVSVKADRYTAVEPVEVDVQAQRVTGPIELRMTGGGWVGVVFDSVAGGEMPIRLAVQGVDGNSRSRSWTSASAGQTEWVDARGLTKGHIVIERTDDPQNPGPPQSYPFELKEGQNTEVRVRLN